MPTFKDTTHAIYRRLLIIRFKNRYLTEFEYNKLSNPKLSNSYLQDKQLFPKIKKEMSAILNLFISGLIDLRNNDYQFVDSKDSQRAMAEYKKDSDTVREFLEDNYQKSEKGCVSIAEIYEHYRFWYRQNVQDSGSIKFRKNELAKRVKEVFYIDPYTRGIYLNKETNEYERTTVYRLKKIEVKEEEVKDSDLNLPEGFKEVKLV